MAGRRSISVTSPEEGVFTDSCCGEPGSVHFLLTSLCNLCSE